MKKLILLILLLLPSLAWGGQYGQSDSGAVNRFTFSHTSACTSVVIWLGQTDTTTWSPGLDSVNMTEAWTGAEGLDDSEDWAYSTTLNTVGDYWGYIKYWEDDGTVGLFTIKHKVNRKANINTNVGSMDAGVIDAAQIATNAITSDEVDASVIDLFFDEAFSGHITAGSFASSV